MAAKHMRVVDDDYLVDERDEHHISGFRAVVGDILIVLSVILIAYTVGIGLFRANAVVRGDATQRMMFYELIIWADLLIVSIDIRSGFFTRLRFILFKIIGWALRFVTSLFIVAALALTGYIMVSGHGHDADSPQAAIVFGMALEHGRANHDLELRVEQAVKYAKDNLEARLFLSGGLATENSPSEASVMRDMLTSAGVAEDRLVIDEQAATTMENLINAATTLDANAPVTLITNDFHMMRCVRSARTAGFSDPRRDAAPSDVLTLVFDLMAETVSELDRFAHMLPFIN